MNILTFVLSINGVDILMAVIVALAIYIRRKDGLIAELFKTFGIFCTVFITLHYYERFADFISVQFVGKEVATELFAFCLLFFGILLAFVFISGGWSLILRIKSFEIVDRWSHMVLSPVRGYFIGSMIFLALILTGQEFFVSRAQKSVSGALFSSGAVELYKVTYSKLVENFFPGERISEAAFKLIGKESGKTKGLY